MPAGPGSAPSRQELKRPDAIATNGGKETVGILAFRPDALGQAAADDVAVGQQVFKDGDYRLSDIAVFAQRQGQGNRQCIVSLQPASVILKIDSPVLLLRSSPARRLFR
jgi:hypothetical protein